MRSPLVLVTSVLLAVLGHPARADEQVPAPIAIEASLPAPTAAKPFEVSADLVRGGTVTAKFQVRIEPQAAGFLLTESLEYASAASGTVLATARTDARLFVTSGSYRRRNTGGFLEARYHRGVSKTETEQAVSEGAPFHIAYRTQEYENEIEAKLEQPARTSLAAILYLATHAPRVKRAYAWTDFEPDPAAGDAYVADARFECHGKARWRVDAVIRDAWVFSYTRGKRSYRLALDAETGAFRGLEVVGMDLALVPEGARTIGPADEAAPGLATPIERARRRALAIRRALPSIGKGWRYEGELLLGEYKLGRVILRMEPTSVGGEPAWLVTERTVREAGAARVVGELTAFLKPDLAVIRGETLHHAPSGKTVSTFTRSGSAILTRHRTGPRWGDPIAAPVRADATVGLASVVTFLQHVPETQTTYVLSGFDPRYVSTPKAGSGGFPQDVADAFIEVEGPSAYSTGVRLFSTLTARVSTKTGRRYTVHVDRRTRALVAVVGGLPSTTIAPKGTPGKRPDFFNTDAEPRSAYEAFIRFGRGYHLPREDYLAKAFHWERMLAHDVRAGTYAADADPKAFRRDWIQEFVTRSKHRKLGDCDDLLLQILMTSKETHGENGAISIATLPAYGGHVYRIERVDGRWYITQID